MAIINGKGIRLGRSHPSPYRASPWKCKKISYDDELEKEVAYGKGQRPRGYGEGNYKSEGKLSLLRDDYDDIVQYCKSKNLGRTAL
ncbi:hypothetical protein WDD9_006381 [Paenibacillus melissococcoides]|uniref:hypothetical protein n=1 Tax=Paenibacillus melissococcoides TaxID=2912268 RepID=UPI0021C4B2D9|nr:hypothetical protein [Paenibacillus melissococcoides]CAH8721624.1 hypothetical protein WDD9_006381 [Paenibacillus melissococcoides]